MTEMWNRVEWLKPVDTAILQFLAPPKELKLTPSNIAINIEYDRKYVANRCLELSERGLISEADVEGYPAYEITQLGRMVVDREISARELKYRTALLRDYELVDEE